MNMIVAAFMSALLFGLGLGISGMTLPTKVIGFLDITGDWDISLMFVMVGAILTHAVSYRFITKRASPLFAAKFSVPTRRDLDRNLIIGAAIFGIGWALGGFCPGPALVTITTGKPEVIVFVGCMIAGMFIQRNISKRKAS